MRDALKDLQTITTIPYKTLKDLFDKFQWVLCDEIETSHNKGEEFASIDIGIGEIDVCVDNDELKFRFIPSSKFEDNIKETIKSSKNPLVLNIEESLVKRIINTYKDFF